MSDTEPMQGVPLTQPYRPSNGDEGEGFMGAFCGHCERDRHQNCEIAGRALWCDIGDPDYPAEWVCDEAPWPGNPRCTAFVERTSVKRAEPASVIPDPRQMTMAL